MEIWFYHLQSQPLEGVLPALLEASLARGWRTVVQGSSEERLEALDGLLWTYKDASFLPHGRASDGDAERQPIYLTSGDENPNGAQLRILIDSADGDTPLRPGGDEYERIILIFDGNDSDQLAAARLQWKRLKEAGFALAYWQQGERGGWEKKA